MLSERDSFGQGDFDFTKQDPKKVNKKYEEAEARLEELKGKINHQVNERWVGCMDRVALLPEGRRAAVTGGGDLLLCCSAVHGQAKP